MINIGRLIDLKDQKFGRLLVLESSGKDKWGSYLWKCECECGNKIIVNSNSLRRGLTKSCGCYAKEINLIANKKYNKYDLSGEYGIGYTNKGEEFYFDLEDYNKIKDYCWWLNGNGYPCTKIKSKYQSMHRLILNYNEELQTDHINRIKHDNRKENLRLATNQQNSFNKDKYINNSTGYKGVYWNKKLEKWCSQITVGYKNIHLGYFKNIEDAIQKRLNASKKYFGEYNINSDYY